MLLLVLSPVRWISLRIIVLVHRLLPGDGGGWPHKQYSCASLCWKGACRKGVSIYCPDWKHFHTFCVMILYFPIPGFAPYCCPSHVAEAHSRIHLLQQVCNFGYYFGWQSLHDSSSDISSHLLVSLSFLLGMYVWWQVFLSPELEITKPNFFN